MSNFRDVKFDGDISHVGRKRGNPANWKENYFKAEHKDAAADDLKLYTVVIPSASGKSLTAITLDGTTYTLADSVDATKPDTFTAGIQAVLEGHDPEVINPIFIGKYDGTDTTFYYAATNVLTSITWGSTAVNATVKSTEYQEQGVQFVVADDATGVAVEGSASATFAAGADAAATKTNVEAALATAGVTGDVTAVVTQGTGERTVKVYSNVTAISFTVAGVYPTKIGTYWNFK